LSQFPGIKQVGEISGLSGRPLGLVAIISGILIAATTWETGIGAVIGVLLALGGAWLLVFGEKKK
jgi:hypothetical protein